MTSCFECNYILCNCCWKEFVSFCKFQFPYKKKTKRADHQMMLSTATGRSLELYCKQLSLLIGVCVTYRGLLNKRKLITATPNTCRLIKLPSRLSQPCNQAMHFLFWEQAPITLTFHTEICWCTIGKKPTQFNSVYIFQCTLFKAWEKLIMYVRCRRCATFYQGFANTTKDSILMSGVW